MAEARSIKQGNVDDMRKQVDLLSLNMRRIFHGDHTADFNATALQPVDIAEKGIVMADEMVRLSGILNNNAASDEELPTISGIIGILKWCATELEKVAESDLKGHISEEYYKMFIDKTGDLSEAAEDLEITFFQLREDQDFNDITAELEGL